MRFDTANDQKLQLTPSGGTSSLKPVLGIGGQGPQGLPGNASAAWTAATAVTTGTVRQAPDGSWIKSIANRTTGATFDATEKTFWTATLATAGTLESDALSASIADAAPSKWKASTAYSVGAIVQAPDGGIVRASSAHTSAAAFDTTKWRPADGLGGLATRGPVRNRRKLARFEAALKAGLTHIVVVGNSISWGVGSNDDSSTTSGYVEDYEQYAWPVQLRKMLARDYGIKPTQGWMGLTSGWAFATLGGTAAASQSVGPFGVVGSGYGGVNLTASGDTVTIAAAKARAFTCLDVFYYGSAAGVTGKDPTVKIDGATIHTGTNVANPGNICVESLTGLTDAEHEIILANPGGSGSTNSIYVFGVVPHRGSGVTVSKIAVPGQMVKQAVGEGASYTTQQKGRMIDGAVLKGYSDLVVISMTANEVYQQLSPSEYTTYVQALITSAVAGGACVLLMGDLAVYNEETDYAIKGSQYRAVLQSLSDSNDHVAYADFNAAITPDRSRALAQGIFPTVNPGTVHPMNEGHRRMADFMRREVLPGPSI